MLRARLEGTCSVWETASGTLRVESLSPGVTCVRFRGHLTDEFVEPVANSAARSVLATDRAIVFQDWEGMTTYDMSARASLVAIALRHRARTERVHFLAGSTVVRLAVSVANFVVGIFVLHEDRRSFEEALTRATAEDMARRR